MSSYTRYILSLKLLLILSILELIIHSVHSSSYLNVNNDQLSPSPSNSMSQIVIPYLQSELSACSGAQQNILKFLHEKCIPIGLPIGTSLRQSLHSSIENIKSRIVVSTSSNNIECRVSLGKAPIGAKCVAPCGCTGSSKWVQFSELNKLRRKDPQQWTSCPTCQQKFDYSIFAVYGGLSASLIGYVLDNLIILRSTIIVLTIVVGYIGSFKLFLYRFLVSKALWQQFPQWSKITHIPLALKFWAIKIILQYLGEKYITLEKNTILATLADIETKLIEDNLPVTTQSENENNMYTSDELLDSDEEHINS